MLTVSNNVCMVHIGCPVCLHEEILYSVMAIVVMSGAACGMLIGVSVFSIVWYE